MEQEGKLANCQHEGKQSHFDPRLIAKIVSEVEAGLPRKEANRIYGLGKSTLCIWMRKYGSSHYHEKIKRRSYTKLQKRTIVSAVEQGRMSISEACSAYGIKDAKLIRAWLLKYREEKVDICTVIPSVMSKKPALKDAAEVESLRKALQEAEMKIKALNTLIDVAEEQLKIDIRKKPGARQSSK
ncbi:MULTISPECIES: transposase [unclassified Flavobacterium]|uniref:transposase n=1 Tax=unclassified Flavobacterium TaxID=196869 RepID=UPI001F13DA94|nr:MULTISPECIES: transposase [unclassified Flavobacterium]UMY64587.1 hypothetical protein MKO97_08690 [Flavobacterium sp. HJ-32-4]UMY64627.1 hypothetical protein MKO97_08895 [Flavobacterium sp. HJ-32-4]UMY65661.1 hypothetical protein MKO97_14320 [Flavobacterium sp. HJ-32-4]UMY67120.1 hypothetical protein MKO97_07005 [Flavobacterium sp. HJ-32-4]